MHINIQLVHSFDDNIRICQHEKVISTEVKPMETSLSRVMLSSKECINCLVI